MKALLLTGNRTLQVAEVSKPIPGPYEVLIRVAACGICGSDVHGYDGSSGRRIPPLVMGHEAAGTIAQIGDEVSGFEVGDRVTFDSTIYCGECHFCREGRVNLCERRQVVGVSCAEFHREGAFAEFVVVPQRILYKLPASMPMPEAAMVEAVAVALHAVRVSGLKPDQSCLVIGAGMIGLLVMQAAWAAGCRKVLIADLDESRLEIAKRLGPVKAITGGSTEMIKQATEYCSGVGPDVVYEAVGVNQTVMASLNAVRKGGTVTLVGNISPEANFPLQRVVSREIRVLGSAASAGEYLEAIDLIANGTIKVKQLISAVSPLEKGPEWFDRLYSREPNLMKVVLTVDEADKQSRIESSIV
ncbi:MAG: galactitol-1-phosphate 5-dehydrogenase [Acidobacteria bacterium]|nr:galactitol-1-phosphate 5-dehydrogenase [Acidobacteriota bacterium]